MSSLTSHAQPSPWSHAEPLPLACYSVFLQVLEARAIPRVHSGGRGSSCPSKFTAMLREKGFAREESTLSAGSRKLKWAPVSPRYPKGRTLLRRAFTRAGFYCDSRSSKFIVFNCWEGWALGWCVCLTLHCSVLSLLLKEFLISCPQCHQAAREESSSLLGL